MLCVSDRVGAQTPGVERCYDGGRPVRAVVGASLGAWLGFVAVKIRLSDWNDGSRSAAAHRVRNQATISGALIGAALGSIRFRGSSCARHDARPATDANVRQVLRPITVDEIERSGINGSVYDLVYALRRNWLNVRGVDTPSEAPRVVTKEDGQEVLVPGEPRLVIYLDNARLGTISQLRDVSLVGVTGVRYFDGPQATFRWGAGHQHGAIQVLTVTVMSP